MKRVLWMIVVSMIAFLGSSCAPLEILEEENPVDEMELEHQESEREQNEEEDGEDE